MLGAAAGVRSPGELTPRAITSLMARMRGAGDEEITRRVGELFEQLDIAEWADQPATSCPGVCCG